MEIHFLFCFEWPESPLNYNFNEIFNQGNLCFSICFTKNDDIHTRSQAFTCEYHIHKNLRNLFCKVIDSFVWCVLLNQKKKPIAKKKRKEETWNIEWRNDDG